MLNFAAIRTQLWHWKQALMGPVVTIGLLSYQQATGKSPTWGLFGTIIFAGLAWQFYTEWQKEKQRALPKEVPQLYLQYIPEMCSTECSGFFLKTEGEKRASNIRLSSEEVVGDNHVRLRLEWEHPGHPVGDQAVHVKVECRYRKRGEDHMYSLNPGEQIKYFFQHKSANPAEIVVAISYTDMAGNVCPERKFVIAQHTTPLSKYLMDERITCEPLCQAAS